MKSTRARRYLSRTAGLPALLSGGTAEAHAFGARYDLPLPLELYLISAGAAVALSFVIMAMAFDRRDVNARRYWRDLSGTTTGRVLGHKAVSFTLRLISTGLFALVLLAGFWGSQDPAENFGPTFVWIIWWVGFAYIASLIGNIWPLCNPWATLFDAIAWALRRCGFNREPGLNLPLPRWVGAWPAIILFMAFAWYELIAESAKEPASLATAIAVYSAITWIGMAIFGRDVWLSRGEAFTLVFTVFGRFAPLGGRADSDADTDTGGWGFRPCASALITTEPCRLTMTLFIIVMLSTVTFDGFKETPFWANQLQAVALSPVFHPLVRLIHDLGLDYFAVLNTVMLCLFPVGFAGVYLAFCWLTRLAAGGGPSVIDTAGLFIDSIVPIAIAYHLAHYLSYLLTAGQGIIPLLSDPFGSGSNLLGTAGYKTDIGIVSARFVWNSAAIAIVAGHVFAVGVAHFVALKIYEPARRALRSQIPMLVLMVGYTMVSLWILSQPIVGAPSLINLDLRSDRISLASFGFRELCVPLKTGQTMKVDFSAEQPVEFDIHYHDGFSVRFPVRVNGVTDLNTGVTADGDRAYCMMWFNRGLTETPLQYRVDGPPEAPKTAPQN